MIKFPEYQSLEYLDLCIKNPENYNLCRRTTVDNNKLVCIFREKHSHRLHSDSNNNNFEQLNTVIDLVISLSEKLKTNREKYNESKEILETEKLNKNLGYLKDLLEDIFKRIKEDNSEIIKRIEKELIKNNKLLEKILYGK